MIGISWFSDEKTQVTNNEIFSKWNKWIFNKINALNLSIIYESEPVVFDK